MANETLPAGWTRPGRSQEWHYFRAGEKASVCGRFLDDDPKRKDDPDEDDAPANCRLCRKRLAPLRGIRARTYIESKGAK